MPGLADDIQHLEVPEAPGEFSVCLICFFRLFQVWLGFIKSGFIKHVIKHADFNFLLFFQEIFLVHSRRPDEDIENFVHLYFQRHIKK